MTFTKQKKPGSGAYALKPGSFFETAPLGLTWQNTLVSQGVNRIGLEKYA